LYDLKNNFLKRDPFLGNELHRYKVKHIKDSKIVTGIKHRDRAVLKYVYYKYFPLVRWKFVDNTLLTEEDVKDVFQDALALLYKKIKENDFKLESSFKTFLYSLCKRFVLKRLRIESYLVKGAQFDEMIDENPKTINMGYFEPDEIIIKELKKSLYRKHFLQLKEECKMLLQMFVEDVPYEKITEIMGYLNDKYARKRKHKCKEYLKIQIENDFLFQKIKKLENE